jgi:benzodiazapine receptor
MATSVWLDRPQAEGSPARTSSTASRGATLAWVAACVAGGMLVGLLTSGGSDPWYMSLRKPAFNPPAWVFAPVWTVLYALMGLAASLVWQRRYWKEPQVALVFFGLQLAVNFAWSFIFFTAHQVDLALADIAVLWLLVVLTINRFAKVDRRAAWLLVPYLAWVSFATFLNLMIARLN